MPFSTTLREIPSLPAAQGQIANPDGRPSREYVTFFRDLEALLETLQTALEETGQTVLTVATLPSAAGRTGVRYMVSDANATTFNSIVAGGGSNVVPVFSNNVTWRIG
jgi:hypothetical protein